MKNFNLKKYFGVLTNFFGPFKFKKFFKIDPHRNWITLIVLFVFVNFLFVISSFGTFSGINSDEFSPARGTSGFGGATLYKEVLNETIGRFETKEEDFENLKGSRPFFVDPSI